MNHTSDQHPWFQARPQRAPRAPWRNFYVWSDDDTRGSRARIIFVDTEASNWTWDPVRRPVLLAPLLQPPARPQLRQPRRAGGHARGRRFWLDLGVDGFRLDAVPYLYERTAQRREPARDARVPRRLRRDGRRGTIPGRMLLAEANQWPEDVASTSATATSATCASTSR
jgi:maltose alpha-D-glucosyltransferase/alpha-amylase